MIQRVKTGVIADGAITTAKMNDEVENLFSFRNRIINGDMRIDQRNAGSNVTVAAGSSQAFITDRFYIQNLGGDGTLIASQSTDAPTGFTHSLKITTTTAGTISANDSRLIGAHIEGLTTSDFASGTASARQVTISFWVKSSLTGTHSGCYLNGDSTRVYGFTFTISSANTWEYKTVTISGDTTGTWPTNNTTGSRIQFNLGSGNNSLQSTANVWSGTGGSRGVQGSVSLSSTLNANLLITGLQLELGSVATPFERRPYGLELSLCERYYQIISSPQHRFFTSTTSTSGVSISVESLRTEMRTTPSVTSSGGASGVATVSLVRIDNNTTTSRAVNFNPTSVSSIRFYPDGTTTSVIYVVAGMHDLLCSAEI